MDASDVVQRAKQESKDIDKYIRQSAKWFHERGGELIEKVEAVNQLADLIDSDPQTATEIAIKVINSLTGDHVDPVQHVSADGTQYVGVIDYDEFDGYYSFTEYHDISGEYTRAVCGACVDDSTRSSEPFTRHTGDFGSEPFNNEERLHEIMSAHIEDDHTNVHQVETGATLASGTTIAGNTSIHQGNLDTTYTFSASQNFSGGLSADGAVTIDRTIQSGETVAVSSSDGMIMSGELILDGTLEVDGTFTTTQRITGNGSITGTGRVEVL